MSKNFLTLAAEPERAGQDRRLAVALAAGFTPTDSARADAAKPRLIILADMGNEPDEEQQNIHLLVCANEMDIEGLVCVTGKFLRETARSEYKRQLHPESGETFHGDYVPVWRWRPVMYADQICRMDWCVKPFKDANHHPLAAFNGDKSDIIVRLKAPAGDELDFDASASTDPDGDELIFLWWHYEEAGTYPGRVFIEHADAAKAKVHIPTGAGGKQIHIILEVRDQNQIVSLSDDRRVVIDASAN